MQVDYIHGNPVKKKIVKKPISKVMAVKLSKSIHAAPVEKTIKKATKSTSPKEVVKISTKKSQGGSKMAKKKRSAAQVAATKKLVALNKKKQSKVAVKKVAKKAVKKVIAKKAVIVKKKIAKKAAKKSVAKKTAKKSKAVPHSLSMLKKGAHAVGSHKGHKTYRKNYSRTGASVGKKQAAGGTKLPVAARFLAYDKSKKKGETMTGEVTRKLKRGKRNTIKKFTYAVTRTNPKRKKHMKKRNPIVVSKNPIIVSNPKIKHKKHTKRNPVSFMKNPLEAGLAFESKMISAISPLNNACEKFLNVGILEIAGLAVGAGLDGMVLSLVNKIPKSNLVLDHIPAEYHAPAVMGLGGLLLHGVNALIAKKGGKHSVILEELSKGMIAAALVKSIASFSKFSSENESLAGYQYTPAMNGAGMNGYIHSNPSASMPTGHSDFQGADFQGADFQGHDNVGGADFDGYVQSMGDMDGDDFGTDSHSMGGNW